jgi:aerobic-type carbon monoxide dehydrogenase small subunit (CoxS/CutS family)
MRVRLNSVTATRVCGASNDASQAAVTLLDELRARGIRSLKQGCRDGSCGACRVVLGGELVASCRVPMTTLVEDVDVEVVVSLEDAGLTPHERSAAARAVATFDAERTTRCALCVPALMLTAAELVRRNVRADSPAFEALLRATHCQCTGRGSLRRALQAAAQGGHNPR